jgi:hypothetical protein
MRVLLAITVLIGAMLALDAPADATQKYKRSAKPQCYAVSPRGYWRGRPPCTVRAWPYSPYDPAGEFRGFPGWARKAFNNLRN